MLLRQSCCRRPAALSGQIAPGDELRSVDGWGCHGQAIEDVAVSHACGKELRELGGRTESQYSQMTDGVCAMWRVQKRITGEQGSTVCLLVAKVRVLPYSISVSDKVCVMMADSSSAAHGSQRDKSSTSASSDSPRPKKHVLLLLDPVL
jgi:hypothetical protein